jgi:tetratricopeptide (TPR) repeat protein
VDLLTTHYRMLMDDQIDTNRYSRTEVLLERHAQLGIDPAVINYYRGEMHRQRGAQGDAEMARDAYLSSISTGRAVPEAYRNVGYLYLKAGDTEKAREHFRRYLEAAPAADDRAMIESYLVDE